MLVMSHQYRCNNHQSVTVLVLHPVFGAPDYFQFSERLRLAGFVYSFIFRLRVFRFGTQFKMGKI